MRRINQYQKTLFAFLLLAIICFLFLLSDVSLFAQDREYYIDKYDINVVLNPDGSADIEEFLYYDFDGQFNGVFRDLDFSETDGIIDPKLYVMNADRSLSEISLYSTDDLDEGGIDGTYNSVESGDLLKFKVFLKSYNQQRTFVYKYTLNNVITKYDDIAEFNRKIVDSNWDVSLNGITIKIKLPKAANLEDIKVYGHGSLLGESKIIDGQNVIFTAPFVRPGEMVETLVLFPRELVPNAKREVDKIALQEIMENERELAEEANNQREEARKQYEREKLIDNIVRIIVVALCVVWLPISIYIYFKYDKELKSDFKQKYYRELPGDYTPSEMSHLLNRGGIYTRDITATLMDLVRKRYLLLTTEKVLKKRLIFQNKEIEEYDVSINPDAPIQTLKRHEEFLINWFIKKLGNGKSIRLSSISDYTKTETNARRFNSDYEHFGELVGKEAEKLGFIDKSSKKGGTIGSILAVVYLIIGLIICVVFSNPWGFALVAVFLITITFSSRISRRTRYGNDQKVKWEAFKRFLKDFSQMDKAVLPSIVIWEHYLVYAISLGVAKEVIKQLPLVISDNDFNNNNLTFMRGPGGYMGFSAMTNTLSSTISTVDNAINSARSVANSTLSSSSGGGGGFSGGSSGGGGGGGGGGAF